METLELDKRKCSKMSKESKELLKRLDTLIAVTAMNKQKMEKLLEGKNQTEHSHISILFNVEKHDYVDRVSYSN